MYRDKIFHHHTEISAVYLDVDGTGEAKLGSRKERTGDKQPLTQKIHIKEKKQAVEIPTIPACSRPALTTLSGIISFSKHLEILMKSRCCSEREREDNPINAGGGRTSSHLRPAPRPPASCCSQQRKFWTFSGYLLETSPPVAVSPKSQQLVLGVSCSSMDIQPSD